MKERGFSTWQARLVVLTLAHVAGTIPIVSIMALGPVIQKQLSLNVTELGLLVTSYYAAQAVGGVAAGRCVDRFGVRTGLLTAHALLLSGTALFTQAFDFGVAVAATGVMGFGYSLTNPSTARGVLLWFSPQRRATAMGVKQTGVPIGGVTAAGIGVLAAFFEWRSLLWGVVIITALNALPCLWMVETAGGTKPRPDASPRRRETLWKRRNIRHVFFASITWNIGQTNFFTYLTVFMRDTVHASQPVAGLCLALAQASSAVGRVGWGVLSDVLFRGRRKVLLVSICGMAAALLIAMMALGPLWGVAVGIALSLALGLTVASFASLSHTLAVEAVEPEHAGAAMGYSLTGTALGGVVGPPLFGLVVDASGAFGFGWLATGIAVAIGTGLVAWGFEERRV